MKPATGAVRWRAGEPIALTKTTEVNAESLSHTIHARPTFAEAICGATEDAFGRAIDLQHHPLWERQLAWTPRMSEILRAIPHRCVGCDKH